jgi:hypothetical protein
VAALASHVQVVLTEFRIVKKQETLASAKKLLIVEVHALRANNDLLPLKSLLLLAAVMESARRMSNAHVLLTATVFPCGHLAGSLLCCWSSYWPCR